MNQCLVCRNAEGGSFQVVSSGVPTQFACGICGRYSTSNDLALQLKRDSSDTEHWGLTPMQRAVLSHRIRTGSRTPPRTDDDIFRITPDVLERIRTSGLLPNPAVQAMNLVRLIGDTQTASGTPISQFPVELHAIIGAFDRERAVHLAEELEEKKLLRTRGRIICSRTDDSRASLKEPKVISLSLAGWARYESEKRGELSGQDGFLALKFNEPDLDDFVTNVLKPIVNESFGCNLYDMRDVSKAGIIDNIMRVRIRDARFVIAELTHGNQGVYWESGFAEGLGKPVIYICEASEFKKSEIHFDTNHCTTVQWSKDDPDRFKSEFVATLRRSLEEQQ